VASGKRITEEINAEITKALGKPPLRWTEDDLYYGGVINDKKHEYFISMAFNKKLQVVMLSAQELGKSK
jgi:hypothetical protein